MNIEQYARALGVSDVYVYNKADVPPGIKVIVDAGEPIARSYAQKIVTYLSHQYNRVITIEDVDDLKTINPGQQTEEDHFQRTYTRNRYK